MAKTKIFIRNMEGSKLLEIFLIAAIAAVLGIRFFLHLTNYPQLGGGRFHIAHMLWGGLLMLVALLTLFAFFGKTVRHGAAIFGGVGFGLFIDELGKFITKNNNYFYQPTVAIIYVIFILLFLAYRRLEQDQILDQSEILANAIDQFEEGAMYGFDEDEKQRALSLLQHLDESHPVKAILRQAFASLPVVPASLPAWYTRAKDWLKRQYADFSSHFFFVFLVVGIILFQTVLKIVYNVTTAKQPILFTIFAVITSIILLQIIHALQNRSKKLQAVFYVLLVGLFFAGFDVFLDNIKTSGLSLEEWGEILASTASACVAVYGWVRLKGDSARGFQLLERALLISIFITQFFTFYRAQFNAVLGLAVNVILLVGVQFAVETAQQRQNQKAQTG